MCKNLGCRVIGTAGSDHGIELLKSIGVDLVYNHRSKTYIEEIQENNEEISVIVEMLANINLQNDLELISKNGKGRILVYIFFFLTFLFQISYMLSFLFRSLITDSISF